jgi:hypothetical protein
VVLKVTVSAAPAVLIRTLTDLTRGEFQVDLVNALKPGDLVRIRVEAGGQASPDSREERVAGIPSITGALEAGGKEVNGTAAPGASQLEIRVSNAAETVISQTKLTVVSEGKFKAQLDSALKEGEMVRARETDGDFSAAVAVKAKPVAAPKISIRSIDASYGTDTITVYFDKLPDITESARITVTTWREVKVFPFSADDLKATKIVLAIDRGLFEGGASDPCPLRAPAGEVAVPRVKFEAKLKGEAASPCRGGATHHDRQAGDPIG